MAFVVVSVAACTAHRHAIGLAFTIPGTPANHTVPLPPQIVQG
jgi:hypothetical protein